MIKTRLFISTVFYTLFIFVTHIQSQNIKEAPFYCSSKNKEAIELFNFGLKSLSFGKMNYAKSAFQKAINLDSTFCDAHVKLAMIYRQQGEIITALYLLDTSLKINPNNPVALQNYAYYWLLAGKQLEAKGNYTKLINLDPTNPEGYYGLGMVLIELTEYHQALLNTQKAIELYKKNSHKIGSEVFYLLGMNYFHLDDYENSMVNLEKVYKSYKKDKDMNYSLAMCYLKLNKLKKAKKYMKRAKKFGAEIPEKIQIELDM